MADLSLKEISETMEGLMRLDNPHLRTGLVVHHPSTIISDQCGLVIQTATGAMRIVGSKMNQYCPRDKVYFVVSDGEAVTEADDYIMRALMWPGPSTEKKW